MLATAHAWPRPAHNVTPPAWRSGGVLDVAQHSSTTPSDIQLRHAETSICITLNTNSPIVVYQG